MSDRDVGRWEALIGVPDGIEHASAIVLDCTPERAVEAAMGRAVQKYGPQAWSRWRFRAEWSAPSVLRTVHFVWRGGVLQRTSTEPSVPPLPVGARRSIPRG